MVQFRSLFLLAGLLVLPVDQATARSSVLEQWRAGLTGAYLTAYSGSIVGNSSSLTEVRLCRNGRFVRRTDAGYTVPGQAWGASKGQVTGEYGFTAVGPQVYMTYRTDHGQSGSFPIYLQRNGRVNIGGTAFAVQQGGAGC